MSWKYRNEDGGVGELSYSWGNTALEEHIWAAAEAVRKLIVLPKEWKGCSLEVEGIYVSAANSGQISVSLHVSDPEWSERYVGNTSQSIGWQPVTKTMLGNSSTPDDGWFYRSFGEDASLDDAEKLILESVLLAVEKLKSSLPSKLDEVVQEFLVKKAAGQERNRAMKEKEEFILSLGGIELAKIRNVPASIHNYYTPVHGDGNRFPAFAIPVSDKFYCSLGAKEFFSASVSVEEFKNFVNSRIKESQSFLDWATSVELANSAKKHNLKIEFQGWYINRRGCNPAFELLFVWESCNAGESLDSLLADFSKKIDLWEQQAQKEKEVEALRAAKKPIPRRLR